MKRNYRFGQQFLLSCLLIFSRNVIASHDADMAHKLVQEFHQIPSQYMFCSETRSEYADAPETILPKMAGYLSQEMIRLFAWVQCMQPNLFEHQRTEKSYFWDFRYGLSFSTSNDIESHIKKVNVLAGQIQTDKSIVIKVDFKTDVAANVPLHTIYKLIYERGQWKIDDIALTGYQIDMGVEGKEWVLPRSKSLKTELQSAYKRAEAKCLQAPTCKAKLGTREGVTREGVKSFLLPLTN